MSLFIGLSRKIDFMRLSQRIKVRGDLNVGFRWILITLMLLDYLRVHVKGEWLRYQNSYFETHCINKPTSAISGNTREQ